MLPLLSDDVIISIVFQWEHTIAHCDIYMNAVYGRIRAFIRPVDFRSIQEAQSSFRNVRISTNSH